MNIRFPVVGAVALVSVLASAAVYEVDSGETLTVTDAENNLTAYPDGISFKDSTGLVLFDTTSAPVMPISGAGTVRKVSSSDWTMAADMKGMTGTFDLSGGGVVSFSRDNAFCKSDAGTVVVSNGTTLSFTDVASRIRYAKLRIAGRGKADRGALEFKNTSADNMQMRYLTLAGDALVTIAAGCTMRVDNELDLNGHDFTLEGEGTFYHAGKVKGEGDITLKRCNSGTLTWELTGSADSVFTPSKTSAVCLTGNTRILYDKAPQKPSRILRVSGSKNSLTQVDYWNSGSTTTNGTGWAGEIVFESDTDPAVLEIRINTEAKKQLFTLLGRISGNGKLYLPISACYGRVCLAYPENTFTGGIDWQFGSIVALYKNSIPDYSKLNFMTRSGTEGNYEMDNFEIGLNEDGTGWTYDEAVDCANLSQWTANIYPKFSTLPYGNITPQPLVYNKEKTLASGKYLGSVTPAPIKSMTDDPVKIVQWRGGKAVLTGPITLDSYTIDSPWGTAFPWDAIVAMENATVTNVTDGSLVVGFSYGGVISISNTVWSSSNPRKSSYASTDYFKTETISLGTYVAERVSGGVLYIEDGAVVSNRLCVGGTNERKNGGGLGSVFQSGGTLVMSGGTSTDAGAGALGWGGDGHGYYELLNGTLEAHGSFMIGCYGMGTYYQAGGHAIFGNTFDDGASRFMVGGNNTAVGQLLLSGGLLEVKSEGGFALQADYTSAAISHSAVSVVGPTARLSSTIPISANAGKDGQVALVNVADGGTLQVPSVSQSTKNELFVNFDGGMFVVGADNKDVFAGASGVYAYSRGIAVDTFGKTGNRSTVPFAGATGKGVLSIALDSPIVTAYNENYSKNMTVLGAPHVVIEGDGAGACAFAKYDRASRSVKEIVVTAPGVGYTTATCKLYYEKTVIKTLTSESGAVVLADNANTGSFTKTGEGDFTLLATNTWGGATIVAGGTLKAGCDGAIPTNTAVTISGGGVLDLNGKAAKLASVSYGAGGGKIINATGADVPAADAITLSFADVLAGRFVALSGDVDLSGVTLTLTGDVPALDENAKYPVVKVSDGQASGAPTIVSAPLPKGWVFRVNPSGVKIVKPKGLLMTVR